MKAQKVHKVVNVELRFPKARLFAYQKLAAGLTCFSVLTQAVADAGLICEETIAQLNEDPLLEGQCGSFPAARKVLQGYMKERHDHPTASRLTEASFSQICQEADVWCKSKGLNENNCECILPEKGSSFCQMAPVVLDLLLQQINRL